MSSNPGPGGNVAMGSPIYGYTLSGDKLRAVPFKRPSGVLLASITKRALFGYPSFFGCFQNVLFLGVLQKPLS